MAAAADEEARRLDQRIAEIRRKNEAILRRRKEIEEDKKLAEQQNAVVQLKPSTEDWPRERTPAMKPSKRDMAGSDAINSSYQDTPPSRGSGRRERPDSNSRGRDLMEKGAGPPPDPRSFLFDPDRDGGVDNSRDRSGRARNESEQEFQDRGGTQRERYDQRGRGNGRRGGERGGRDDERRKRGDEAWRVERHKIDEARIQRQRDSDGRWRREWDNEKQNFDVEGDDNKHPALTPTKTLNQPPIPPKSLGGRLSQWKTSVNKEVESDSNTFKRQSRVADHVHESGSSRISAPKISPDRFRNESSEKNNRSPKYETNLKQKVSPLASLERTILAESENFRITITNNEPGRKEGNSSRGEKLRSERQPKKISGILRTSQSSVVSDTEDAPCPTSPAPAKFTQYDNMTFTIRNEPVNIKRSDLEKMSHEDFVKLSQVAKPPLPPFRPSTKQVTQQLVTAEEDDDSWEDVTTSGTESLYESGPESLPGTPLKVSTNQSQTVPHTPEDLFCLAPSAAPQTPVHKIVYQTPPPALSVPEEVISEAIVFVPPTIQTYTCDNTIEAPPYHYQSVPNIVTTAITCNNIIEAPLPYPHEPVPNIVTPAITCNNTIVAPPPYPYEPVPNIVTPAITCNNTIVAPPPYPYEPVTNIETAANHSFNVDNYIVLVKPDTSFEETVHLEHMNAQSGLLQKNGHYPSSNSASSEVINSAIVSNNGVGHARLSENPF